MIDSSVQVDLDVPESTSPNIENLAEWIEDFTAGEVDAESALVQVMGLKHLFEQFRGDAESNLEDLLYKEESAGLSTFHHRDLRALLKQGIELCSQGFAELEDLLHGGSEDSQRGLDNLRQGGDYIAEAQRVMKSRAEELLNQETAEAAT